MTRFTSRRRRACGCARGRAVVVVAELAAALTNPLLRVYGAVDRRDAVAHPDCQEWGHSCALGVTGDEQRCRGAISALGMAPKMSKEAEVQISVLGKSPKMSKDSEEQLSALGKAPKMSKEAEVQISVLGKHQR